MMIDASERQLPRHTRSETIVALALMIWAVSPFARLLI